MLYFIGAVVLGRALLVWSAGRFIVGAAGMAASLGVTPLLVGRTVAIGTRLPELAAAAAGAAKGEPDIAMGNVIGSNRFNLLPALGLPGLVHPAPMRTDALHRDYPVMLLLSVVLLGMAYGFRGPRRISTVRRVLSCCVCSPGTWRIFISNDAKDGRRGCPSTMSGPL